MTTQHKKYDEHKFIKVAAGLAVVTFLVLIGFIIWYFVAGPGSPDDGASGSGGQSDTNTAAMRLALLPWRLTNQENDLEIGKYKLSDKEENETMEN